MYSGSWVVFSSGYAMGDLSGFGPHVRALLKPFEAEDLHSLTAEIRAQLGRLGVNQVDAILAPSATDLFSAHGPALWDRMRALKDQGLCKRIGVSVYASDDPVGFARRFKPDVVQAPASLLDQRLLIDGTLAELAGMGVEVHLRSIFLNGLLFLPPDRAPNHLKAAASRISRARRLIAEGRSDPLQAALGARLGTKWPWTTPPRWTRAPGPPPNAGASRPAPRDWVAAR